MTVIPKNLTGKKYGLALLKANRDIVAKFDTELVQEFMPEAIYTLVAAMRSEDSSWSQKIKAAIAVLDRAEGTPGKARDRNVPSGVVVMINTGSGPPQEITVGTQTEGVDPEHAMAVAREIQREDWKKAATDGETVPAEIEIEVTDTDTQEVIVTVN